jgi:DNA polymerase beta
MKANFKWCFDCKMTSQTLLDIRSKVNQIDGRKNTNVNTKLTSVFEKLIVHSKAEMSLSNDPVAKKANNFRIRMFERALISITNHPVEITSGRQAQELNGIGVKIGARIDEIIWTGTLKELEDIDNLFIRVFVELTKITGIGPVSAKKLIIDHGIKSVDDLITKVPMLRLTNQQMIGIKYMKDFAERIPRTEIDEIGMYLVKIFPPTETGPSFEICGSYRRGKTSSGDIDVLFRRERSPALNVIISMLIERGFIIATISGPNDSSWMGVCRLNDGALNGSALNSYKARRIDICSCTEDAYVTTRFAMTGSSVFNQLFRREAQQRGYSVNDSGIYPVDEEGEVNGPAVSGLKTEEDIFAFMGVKYLTPEEREL